MSEATVRLVTRGDDAGVAEGANDAVRDCFEDGVLRNVSVMAPCPAFDHATERLAGVEGLCVGVHVTLTAEWERPTWGPVREREAVPSLVDGDGELPTTADEFVEREPDREEVVREMTAQVERLRDVGFDPSYLDVHMAVQRRVDWLADAVTELCDREGLVDGTTLPPLPGAGPVGTGPDWLLDALDDAEPGTYLVVGHPVYETADTTAIVGHGREPGEVAADRVDQRRLFTDDRVVESVETRDVELVRYDELD